MTLTKSAGLYLHIPFCRSKCRYCSFCSSTPKAGDKEAFVAALKAQIVQTASLPEVQSLTFATLFFGGGTPSILAPEILGELLGQCCRSFSWNSVEPEISIEVNPGTVDAKGLAQLRRAGFNRLSIGIQSLDDTELGKLGRIHSREQALATVHAAQRAEFTTISCDLMYGLAGQTQDSWKRSLEEIVALGPQHLSLYELTVEEETPLWLEVESGHYLLPPEEEVLAMMGRTQELTAQAGLERYEISNYALHDHQCRHNLNYWHNGSYLGLGPGAVSNVGGERRAAVADLRQYCHLVAQGLPVWDEVEQLTTEAAFRETVVMGLRMTAGVSISRLKQRFTLDLPTYYGDLLTKLVDQGFLHHVGDSLRLTDHGLALANRVMAELV